MTTVQSIILGIIEGLTEFLPVSSTAHMKFANPMLGVEQSNFTDMFEIVIQLAAIFAVVILYWKKFTNFKSFNFYIKLIIAVIPALVFGSLFGEIIKKSLGSLTFIASVMVIGGVILLFVDKWFKNLSIDKEEDINYFTALKIGCFQVLAFLFPGLSRSASTIIGGMSQKLTRNVAAEFSFFLAVPTMFAASVKSGYDAYKNDHNVFASSNLTLLLIGGAIAFVVSLAAMKWMVSIVKKYGFKPFGIYRIIVGILMLILIFAKVI